jgi:hypothetical protein
MGGAGGFWEGRLERFFWVGLRGVGVSNRGFWGLGNLLDEAGLFWGERVDFLYRGV